MIDPRCSVFLIALSLALPAMAQEGEKAKDSDSKELMLEIDKDELGAKAGELKFEAEQSQKDSGPHCKDNDLKCKEAADKILYKGYKHKNLDSYDVIAIKKGILKPDWSDKCSKDEKCGAYIRAGGAQAGGKEAQKSKDKIHRIAKKIAFLDSAKKELEKGLGEAKGGVEGKKKIEAARSLIKKDLKKAVGEAKKANAESGMEIFTLPGDLEGSGDPSPAPEGTPR